MTRNLRMAAAAALALLATVIVHERAQGREAQPARAAKLTLPASAASAASRAPVRRAPAPARLSAAVTRQLALEAGMPMAFMLNGTPTSLSARRMYVAGVAHLSSTYSTFTTDPDSDHFRLGDDRTVTIHFNSPKAGTFVLIAIHGTKTFGGTAEARLFFSQPEAPAEPVKAVASVGPIIPFVVECKSAGWQQVVFLIEGAQVGYDMKRIDLSVFN